MEYIENSEQRRVSPPRQTATPQVTTMVSRKPHKSLSFSKRTVLFSDLKSIRIKELDNEYIRERQRLSRMVRRLKKKLSIPSKDED